MPENAPTLPGMEHPGQPPLDLRIVQAVQSTLDTLREAGALRPEHDGLAQLAVEAAEALAMSKRAAATNGRAFTAHAMNQRAVLEILQALPAPANTTQEETLEQALARIVAEQQA